MALIEALGGLATTRDAVNIARVLDDYGVTKKWIHRHGLITKGQCVLNRVAFLDPHFTQLTDSGASGHPCVESPYRRG